MLYDNVVFYIGTFKPADERHMFRRFMIDEVIDALEDIIKGPSTNDT